MCVLKFNLALKSFSLTFLAIAAIEDFGISGLKTKQYFSTHSSLCSLVCFNVQFCRSPNWQTLLKKQN